MASTDDFYYLCVWHIHWFPHIWTNIRYVRILCRLDKDIPKHNLMTYVCVLKAINFLLSYSLGRRSALILFTITYAIFNITAALATSYSMFVVVRYFIGMGVRGSQLCAMVYGMITNVDSLRQILLYWFIVFNVIFKYKIDDDAIYLVMHNTKSYKLF